MRFRVHQENAQRVADFLSERSEVSEVIYPGLFQNPRDRKRNRKYLETGNGPMVGFELKGGKQAGQKFIDNLQMVYHVANVGDVRTLAIHPASTTHSQLSAVDQKNWSNSRLRKTIMGWSILMTFLQTQLRPLKNIR